jgi:hypothetical protein
VRATFNDLGRADETPPNKQYQAPQVFQLDGGRQLTAEEQYALLAPAYYQPKSQPCRFPPQLANQRVLVYPNLQTFGMYTPQQTPGSGMNGWVEIEGCMQVIARVVRTHTKSNYFARSRESCGSCRPDPFPQDRV